MADKQTNSLSGNDEGGTDKGTDTAQLESNAPQSSNPKIEPCAKSSTAANRSRSIARRISMR